MVKVLSMYAGDAHLNLCSAQFKAALKLALPHPRAEGGFTVGGIIVSPSLVQ